MIQTVDKKLVWQYFNEELGLYWSDDFQGTYWYNKAQVAIAVGYNGFIGKICMIHTVIKEPSAVTRTIIKEVFEYPFNRCGLNAVMAPVEATNEKALEFNKRLGFREVHRIKQGMLDCDLILLQMDKSQCRWIKEH